MTCLTIIWRANGVQWDSTADKKQPNAKQTVLKNCNTERRVVLQARFSLSVEAVVPELVVLTLPVAGVLPVAAVSAAVDVSIFSSAFSSFFSAAGAGSDFSSFFSSDLLSADVDAPPDASAGLFSAGFASGVSAGFGFG